MEVDRFGIDMVMIVTTKRRFPVMACETRSSIR